MVDSSAESSSTSKWNATGEEQARHLDSVKGSLRPRYKTVYVSKGPAPRARPATALKNFASTTMFESLADEADTLSLSGSGGPDQGTEQEDRGALEGTGVAEPARSTARAARRARQRASRSRRGRQEDPEWDYLNTLPRTQRNEAPAASGSTMEHCRSVRAGKRRADALPLASLTEDTFKQPVTIAQLGALKTFHKLCIATDLYFAKSYMETLGRTMAGLMPQGSTLKDWPSQSESTKTDAALLESFEELPRKLEALASSIMAARAWGANQPQLPWGWAVRICNGPPTMSDIATDAPACGGISQPDVKEVCKHQCAAVARDADWYQNQYDHSFVLSSMVTDSRPVQTITPERIERAQAIMRRYKAAVSTVQETCSALNHWLPAAGAGASSNQNCQDSDINTLVYEDEQAKRWLIDLFTKHEQEIRNEARTALKWTRSHQKEVRSWLFKARGSDTVSAQSAAGQAEVRSTGPAIESEDSLVDADLVIELNANLKALRPLYLEVLTAAQRSAAESLNTCSDSAE